MSRQHILTPENRIIGYSSHYDIPTYAMYLNCSCGWSVMVGHNEKIEKFVQTHKIDVLIAESNLEFVLRG